MALLLSSVGSTGGGRRPVCEPVGVGLAAALAKAKGKILGGGSVFRGKGSAAG